MKVRTIVQSLRPFAAALVAATLAGVSFGIHALDRTEIRQQNDVPFVTGGIGDQDQQRTKQLGESMNLQLVFARDGGAYLADVDVAIRREGGEKLLEVDSADPLLFAEVPPGRYQIVASFDGRPIRRDITVPARGQHVEHFLWRMP